MLYTSPPARTFPSKTNQITSPFVILFYSPTWCQCHSHGANVTHPQFLADEVTIEVVDDVGILVLLHHDNLVDDQFLLWLLGEVHLFDGNFSPCRHLYGNVDCARRPGDTTQGQRTLGQCRQCQTPWGQHRVRELYGNVHSLRRPGDTTQGQRTLGQCRLCQTPWGHNTGSENSMAMYTVSDALGTQHRVRELYGNVDCARCPGDRTQGQRTVGQCRQCQAPWGHKTGSENCRVM